MSITNLRQEIEKLNRQLAEERKRQIKEFGSNVRTRRKEMGKTQEDLSISISITRVQVANIETGNSGTSLATLIDICDALQTTPNDLLSY